MHSSEGEKRNGRRGGGMERRRVSHTHVTAQFSVQLGVDGVGCGRQEDGQCVLLMIIMMTGVILPSLD